MRMYTLNMCVPILYDTLFSTSVVKIPSLTAAYCLPLRAHLQKNVTKVLPHLAALLSIVVFTYYSVVESISSKIHCHMCPRALQL